MFLQQFNFEIKYKKGSQHSNADALSRQPPISTLTCDSTLLASTAKLIQFQQEDPRLSLIRDHVEQGSPLPKCPPGLRKCFIHDGILCRSYKESSTGTEHVQIVVPDVLKDTIMRETHGLGHLGIKKTLDTIKTKFYWPGYEKDVEDWVKQCSECQKHKGPQPALPAPMGTITATYPFEKISWDIMGPLPLTPRGHQYILVVTDLFTKWVEAFPLPNTTANTLATILMNEIVCRFGVPAHLHSDQGANLRSAVVQKLCQLLGIHSTRTSAYHPEGNGQVERFNQTLEAMLAKMINGSDQHEWDLYLPKALMAYRTSLHEATGFTPYHLVFGHSPQLPIDVMLGRVSSPLVQSYPQFVQQTHRFLKEAYNVAQQKLSRQYLRQKGTHDSAGTASEFQIGDVVWLYTPVVKQGNTKKFTSFWRGPYTVIDKSGPVNYTVQLHKLCLYTGTVLNFVTMLVITTPLRRLLSHRITLLQPQPVSPHLPKTWMLELLATLLRRLKQLLHQNFLPDRHVLAVPLLDWLTMYYLKFYEDAKHWRGDNVTRHNYVICMNV